MLHFIVSNLIRFNMLNWNALYKMHRANVSRHNAGRLSNAFIWLNNDSQILRIRKLSDVASLSMHFTVTSRQLVVYLRLTGKQLAIACKQFYQRFFKTLESNFSLDLVSMFRKSKSNFSYFCWFSKTNQIRILWTRYGFKSPNPKFEFWASLEKMHCFWA